MWSLGLSLILSPPGKAWLVCFLSHACLLCNLNLMPSFGKQNLIGEQPARPAKQITSVLLTFPPIYIFFLFFKNQNNCVQGFTSLLYSSDLICYNKEDIPALQWHSWVVRVCLETSTALLAFVPSPAVCSLTSFWLLSNAFRWQLIKLQMHSKLK